MTILAPCDAEEMRQLMMQTLDWPGPIYVRNAKGGDEIITETCTISEIGKVKIFKEGADGLFVSTGIMTQRALEAATQLQNDGLAVGVVHVHTIKPLDSKKICNLIKNTKTVITVEEHYREGGLGSTIIETVSDEAPEQVKKITRCGLPNIFVDKYGSQDKLLEYYNLEANDLKELMLKKSRG